MWILHTWHRPHRRGLPAGYPVAEPRGDPRDARGQPMPLHRLPFHRRGDRRGGQRHETSAVTERRCGRAGKGGARMRPWMRFGIRFRIVIAMMIALLAGATGAQAADPLVVSIWGGNWKD